MPDKTYAKVVLNGTTYVDLTSDTVDPSTLLSGYTAHNRSGELITGSFDTSIFVLKMTVRKIFPTQFYKVFLSHFTSYKIR